ncbi:ABC transporter permease [Ureibacillus manganicus]|uniref:Glycine/betaine ABC transporter n=1 Tax=Ureibacillus manganicus DSM 26584 TaxID=1384049 RepID=A0A0A3I2Z5_9BACL|nr:proline/glycine betaine ABC transporter permease [Ureibacillus manganicus]KGR77855.1 glycine/betaine ABC transporter [Ureibacillus manganicus DSM 26584]
MSQFLDFIPKIPVADSVEDAMDLLTDTFAGFFDVIKKSGKFSMEFVTDFLVMIPPVLFILIIAAIAFFATKRKFGLAIFSIVGLLFIYNQGLWEELMNTITLVLFSSVIAVIIGIPLGILMSKSKVAETIIQPLLDFMQTMPGFVYLIPAVAFFGIGVVPGVFASIIFALPPVVRFTNLGIRQVPKELVEAADSYGSTGWQKLYKVELPIARPTIMAGVNQTVLLSLSMVVIASMIGAPGLGRNVLSALQQAKVGNGFVAGISLVILAIIVDRLTQSFNKKRQ